MFRVIICTLTFLNFMHVWRLKQRIVYNLRGVSSHVTSRGDGFGIYPLRCFAWFLQSVFAGRRTRRQPTEQAIKKTVCSFLSIVVRYKQLSCLKACNNGKSVRYLLLLTAGMKRSDRSAPLASGRMSGRPLAGPPSDQSSVDNLRGNRAPKAQSACPLKATQAVQSQSERKDAAATDTPNPKHSEGALQMCVCVCVCVCACVCVQH